MLTGILLVAALFILSAVVRPRAGCGGKATVIYDPLEHPHG